MRALAAISIFAFGLFIACQRKSSVVRDADSSPLSAPATPATPAAVQPPPTTTPLPQPSPTPASLLIDVAQRLRGAVIIVSVFEETGHLSANGHGFFVSEDGKFVADRSVATGGVNAVVKLADGAIFNVSGALTQNAAQSLVLLKADTSHSLPFLVPSTSALPETGDEVEIVLSPIERTNPLSIEEKISGRFSDEAGEWFEVTPAVSTALAGAPVINYRGELIGVVTLRGGGKSCVIRPARAAAALLSQVSSKMTASWANVAAAGPSATPTRTAASPKAPFKGSKLVYAPPPRYPSDARQPGSAGQVSGSFRVLFDAKGRAVAVRTIRSTGNSAFDQAAVSALQEWRSEAGPEWNLVVPITSKP